MALALENVNPKLLGVVSVAYDDALQCVDDSLVEILKLRFGSNFEPEYLSRKDIKRDVLLRF